MCLSIVQHKKNLYQITFTEVCVAVAANFVGSRAGGGPVGLWHRMFGHLNVRSVYTLQSMVRGINLGKTSHPTSTLVCEACTNGKQCMTKLDNDERGKQQKP